MAVILSTFMVRRGEFGLSLALVYDAKKCFLTRIVILVKMKHGDIELYCIG